MRKYFFAVLLSFLLNGLYAQEKSDARKSIFSIGIGSGINFFTGNNFIAKTYKTSIPFFADVRFSVYQGLGVGGGFEAGDAKLKTTQYIGNSTDGSMTSWFGYVFYNVPVGNRWLFVPKAGIASYKLTNTLTADDYYGHYEYHTYGTSYFLSPEIDYSIVPGLSISAGLQYGYLQLHNVRADENAIGTSYQRSNQLNIGLGVRFRF